MGNRTLLVEETDNEWCAHRRSPGDIRGRADKNIPELCHMKAWSSVAPARFRRRIGAPRRSARPSIQYRIMESPVRFAHAHWEARLWWSFDRRRQKLDKLGPGVHPFVCKRAACEGVHKSIDSCGLTRWNRRRSERLCGRGWKRLRSGGVAVGTGATGGRSVEFADFLPRLGLFGAPEHFWPTRQIPEPNKQTGKRRANMGLPRLLR